MTPATWPDLGGRAGTGSASGSEPRIRGTLPVAAVVAWILLHMLYLSVKRIDRNIRGVWEAATRVAANTATTWILPFTPETASRLSKELDKIHTWGV